MKYVPVIKLLVGLNLIVFSITSCESVCVCMYVCVCVCVWGGVWGGGGGGL